MQLLPLTGTENHKRGLASKNSRRMQLLPLTGTENFLSSVCTNSTARGCNSYPSREQKNPWCRTCTAPYFDATLPPHGNRKDSWYAHTTQGSAKMQLLPLTGTEKKEYYQDFYTDLTRCNSYPSREQKRTGWKLLSGIETDATLTPHGNRKEKKRREGSKQFRMQLLPLTGTENHRTPAPRGLAG